MKIVFFDVKNYEKSYFEKNLDFESNEILFFNESLLQGCGLSDEVLSAEILSVTAFSRLNPEVLDKFKNLKLITTRSVGFSHIDRKYCEKRGIEIAITPHYGDNTVAEFAFALLLNLIRKVHFAISEIKYGGDGEKYEGVELFGKTIGIVGVGSIGMQSVRIAHGFGMKILCNDLFKSTYIEQKFHAEYVGIETLCENADFILLHAPYTEQNYHLFNERLFDIMKPNACLVNTARGELIDTKALYKALTNGKIKGAALDVVECEELFNPVNSYLDTDENNCSDCLKKTLINHLLASLDNVIVTPHIAYNTKEAAERILQMTAQNIREFSNGEKLTNSLENQQR